MAIPPTVILGLLKTMGVEIDVPAIENAIKQAPALIAQAAARINEIEKSVKRIEAFINPIMPENEGTNGNERRSIEHSHAGNNSGLDIDNLRNDP